jgi:hypothetical protein
MRPVEPQSALPEGFTRCIFAKDQPEYFPLPAVISPDGVVMTEWEPTAEELECLFTGGHLRIWLHTFGKPLQPISVAIAPPECGFGGGC